MNPSRLNARRLREAHRTPAVPFSVALKDGTAIEAVRLLRVLPGKRIVAEGRYDNKAVLIKLFIASGSERHWRRERQGIAALIDADIPTPPIVLAGELSGGGHAILTRFLNDAETLSHDLAKAATPQAALDTLTPALELVARLHNAGLAQDDLHLGNFLVHQGRTYVIDGDAVRSAATGAPLGASQACENLALLLAQLPAEWDERQTALLERYHRVATVKLNEATLRERTQRTRGQRLRDFLAKSRRDCTLFAVRQRFSRFVAARREQLAGLTPLLADPDCAIANGKTLKDGGTATVARIDMPEYGAVVVKRYNLKNLKHALSRLWRPSRAAHSWREGLRLQFLGIATPAPLALVEQRYGPLRGRAWLITFHCDGPSLLEHLDPAVEPAKAEADALVALFRTLQRERISHGDLKATNLLWHNGRVVLIDLDAVRQHAASRSYRRSWRKDRARLLRNWPVDSRLHRWLDANLPPD